MSQTFLLDTVAAIAFLNGEPAILVALPTYTEVIVPIIALGELHAGAQKSARIQANLERVREFISKRRVLLCDEGTAEQYGIITIQLRKKGRPIPQNDIWIAGLAMQHGLVVLTRDAHFQHVDGLQTQAW